MHELELKFGVPDAVVDTLGDALLLHGAERLRLQAHYFDTADGRLAQHRIALRLRREGSAWVQTLKAPGDGPAHRLEHEVLVTGPAGAADTVPALDIRRHDGNDAGRALAAVLPGSDTPLIERHGTDVLRLRCPLQDASVHADRGRARHRPHARRIGCWLPPSANSAICRTRMLPSTRCVPCWRRHMPRC